MKAFKAFTKPFGVKRSVKTKIQLIFISIPLSEMQRSLRVKTAVSNMWQQREFKV